MNYLPFCGYWFYGGTSASQTASFYCSWGLLAVAPVVSAGIAVFSYFFKKFVNLE